MWFWDPSLSSRIEGGKEGGKERGRVELWLIPRTGPVFWACSDGIPQSALVLALVSLAVSGWLFPRVLSDRRTQGPLHTSSTS